MDLKELDLRLAPSHFFDLEVPVSFLESKKDLFKKKYKLGVDTQFSFEDDLCACFIGWTHKQLIIGFDLEEAFGVKDFLQLFFDTKNLKLNTKNRFCHVFSVKFEDDVLAMKETTLFKNPEDMHELCDPVDLRIESEDKKLILTIENTAFFKWEPKNKAYLGFSYHLKLQNWTQIFYYSSRDFGVEQHPKLWQTLILKT